MCLRGLLDDEAAVAQWDFYLLGVGVRPSPVSGSEGADPRPGRVREPAEYLIV